MSNHPKNVVLNIIPESSLITPIFSMKQSDSEEDKLKSHREYKKEVSRRNYHKTIEYKQIAYFKTNEEKIKALLLILYPHIANYNQEYLDAEISNFLHLFRIV